jgi:hypothetical protein
MMISKSTRDSKRDILSIRNHFLRKTQTPMKMEAINHPIMTNVTRDIRTEIIGHYLNQRTTLS